MDDPMDMFIGRCKPFRVDPAQKTLYFRREALVPMVLDFSEEIDPTVDQDAIKRGEIGYVTSNDGEEWLIRVPRVGQTDDDFVAEYTP